MITITEEPYDGEVAAAFVGELLAELNERYADVDAAAAEDDLELPDDDAYLAEVTPHMVRPPLGVFLVAWVEGEPGACGAVKPLDSDPTIGEIKRMYTRPTARRRGLSRRILEMLEQRALELGYRRLQLETGTQQPEAMALYESHGWHRIAPYGHYKDAPDSVCYAKALDPPA